MNSKNCATVSDILLMAFVILAVGASAFAVGPDTDNDGVPDSADVCPGFDDAIDSDSDGIPDGCDNCPSDSNADQLDSDPTDASLSPVLALRLEDGSGTTATDEVGSWNGAISGATWTTGRQGGRLDGKVDDWTARWRP